MPKEFVWIHVFKTKRVLITKVIPFGCLAIVRFSEERSPLSDRGSLKVSCLRKNFCCSASAIKSQYCCGWMLCSALFKIVTSLHVKVNRVLLETLKTATLTAGNWSEQRQAPGSNKKLQQLKNRLALQFKASLLLFSVDFGRRIFFPYITREYLPLNSCLHDSHHCRPYT